MTPSARRLRRYYQRTARCFGWLWPAYLASKFRDWRGGF